MATGGLADFQPELVFLVPALVIRADMALILDLRQIKDRPMQKAMRWSTPGRLLHCTGSYPPRSYGILLWNTFYNITV